MLALTFVLSVCPKVLRWVCGSFPIGKGEGKFHNYFFTITTAPVLPGMFIVNPSDSAVIVLGFDTE